MWESRVHAHRKTHIHIHTSRLHYKNKKITLTMRNYMEDWETIKPVRWIGCQRNESKQSKWQIILANSFTFSFSIYIQWKISQTHIHTRKTKVYEKRHSKTQAFYISVFPFFAPLIVIKFHRYWLNLRRSKQNIILIKKPNKRKTLQRTHE